MQTVIRTYRNKKGQLVTKTYTYDYSNRVTKTFFKSGKLTKTAESKIAKALGVSELTTAEKMEVTATAKRLRSRYVSQGLPVELLNPERIAASYKGDRIQGMLLNTGFSLEQLAEMTNTSVDVLINPDNWRFAGVDLFINEKGEVYEFEFRYNGSVFTKVQ